MKKITEWIKKICFAIGAIIVFLLFNVGTIGGEGDNFQEVKMKTNEGSMLVAQKYMPNAEPNYEESGVIRYVETFDEEDDADKLFLKLVEEVNNLHSGEKIKKLGSNTERYFLCYGRESSILISQKEYAVKKDFSFYSVSIQYIETESYDWDYLTSRIK